MAARRKTPKPRATSARSKSTPRPTGFRTVTPYLAVHDAEAAIKFYTKAFGARELLRQKSPDGKILHSRLKIGDSIVMISDIYGDDTPGSTTPRDGPFITLHLYLSNVNALWAKAVRAGATVEMPLDDMFWGERYGQLEDPFGHHWSLSTPLKMSEAKKTKLREAAMKHFGGGAGSE